MARVHARPRTFPLVVAATLALMSGSPWAQTRETRTQIESAQTQGAREAALKLSDSERMVAEMWGLDYGEMLRAKVLMQGPRSAFSIPNMSPVEVLGIHARSEAERQKYADKFAHAVFEDVKRTLAFGQAYQTAMERLAGGTPMVSYAGASGVVAPTGSADIGNVPRSLVTEPGATGPSSRARFATPQTSSPVQRTR
ncbi:hypothetical protein [Pseudorhodoferax soli]|uniref:Integrating conjugative element protein (TIGR03759 family) n=1 Tax=Pseudorhodoferax soli TaxID=545864 RepID=A0A368XI82_9BURK|nr:hypothetical protein [Pseudorhodoferax soli]RCW66197.1 integrating conjugative element protein (TIGR03759 family) [Pseudorhodoferax soli]